MNAIEMLTEQHREVEELISRIEDADDSDEKQDLFEEVADALAVHAAIEEKHFYPAVEASRTEDIVLESLEEHLTIKRVLADLLAIDSVDETFDAKIAVLKETVHHHAIEEEEKTLFPKVKKIFDKEELEALGQQMTATMSEMEGTDPRFQVPAQVEASAPPVV